MYIFTKILISTVLCVSGLAMCNLSFAEEKSNSATDYSAFGKADFSKIVRAFFYNRGVDLKTSGYRVSANFKDNSISVRSPDGIREILNLKLCIGDTEDGILQCRQKETRMYSADEVSFDFVAKNGATAKLSFFTDRIEFSATLPPQSAKTPRRVSLLSGSCVASNLLFTPSIDGKPFHYFPLEGRNSIRPGLTSPATWLFAYKTAQDGWLSASLEPYPTPESMDFSGFSFRCENGKCFWEVEYPKCDDLFSAKKLPPLVFRFNSPDVFDLFSRHAAHLEKSGKIVRLERKFPEWHSGINICGWRWQQGKPRRSGCTQKAYTDFVSAIESAGLDFDILIIDDFWGRDDALGVWEVDTNKWPDLRGFIDTQHAKGRHVLLWVCTSCGGLPKELLASGQQVDVDNPEYKKLLNKFAEKMLSDKAGCLNADGIKFDFTASVPNNFTGKKFRGSAYLLERFRLMSEAFLAVKPDAVLDFQCCNPYFSNYQTMLRLNDYFGLPENGYEEMSLRAKIARIVGRDVVTDTDHVAIGRFPYTGAEKFFESIENFGTQSWYLNDDDLNDKELVNLLKSKCKKFLKK